MKKDHLILSLFLLFLGCLNQNHSPEDVLKNFVEIRIGNKVSRAEVMEFLTGKLKQSVESISDEEFERFSNLENVKKSSFKILSKSCQKDVCFLTYRLGTEIKNSSGEFESEIKKIAELKLESGKWYISDVSNIKTYLESVDSINITN
jgi:hypothetical protein